MTYQISKYINRDKIFLVTRSEIHERFDPKMALYNKRVRHALYPMVKLKKLLLGSPQYGANEVGVIRENSMQPRYIRITDIDENGLISANELGVTIANAEKKYVLNENDILIARSGATVGKAYIHRELPYTCLYAGYLIRFIVNPEIILPDYLFTYTQLNPYKEWINAIQRPSAQPNINAEEYQSLEIPLPNLDEQRKIVEYINEAYRKKQAKDREAQQLLDSIDDYLLKALGIELPQHKTDLSSRIFYIQKSNCIERLDPKYNKQFTHIKSLHGSCNWVTLKDIAINTGQYGANEPAIDFKDGDVRYIRITDIDELGNLKEYDKKTAGFIEQSYFLQEGDILFARSGSVGKCYIHRNNVEPAIFAGYLIRYKLDTKQINPWYLFFYCNSSIYKYWIDTIQRPAVQANINAEEYRTLPIPLPTTLSKQNEIVDYIKSIRRKAKSLQEEGKAILENAKREVERMIIGE